MRWVIIFTIRFGKGEFWKKAPTKIDGTSLSTTKTTGIINSETQVPLWKL
ncbi:hypothetical protein [Frischella perrara]|nr:hypothetical protein [Frischella perrara]